MLYIRPRSARLHDGNHAKVNNRLADYEDTGLTPREIIELKARMDGLEK